MIHGKLSQLATIEKIEIDLTEQVSLLINFTLFRILSKIKKIFIQTKLIKLS